MTRTGNFPRGVLFAALEKCVMEAKYSSLRNWFPEIELTLAVSAVGTFRNSRACSVRSGRQGKADIAKDRAEVRNAPRRTLGSSPTRAERSASTEAPIIQPRRVDQSIPSHVDVTGGR